jgi:hypothetical protein
MDMIEEYREEAALDAQAEMEEEARSNHLEPPEVESD